MSAVLFFGGREVWPRCLSVEPSAILRTAVLPNSSTETNSLSELDCLSSNKCQKRNGVRADVRLTPKYFDKALNRGARIIQVLTQAMIQVRLEVYKELEGFLVSVYRRVGFGKKLCALR